MHTTAHEIEASLAEGRLYDAQRAVASQDAADRRADVALRRLAAATYAIAGDERALAAVVDPQLLACRTETEALSILPAAGQPLSHDFLTAATLMAWSNERAGAYDFFREARDRAASEGRPYIAVAACERLAHHCILFGDFQQAAATIDDGLRLTALHRLEGWRLRCAARAVTLALDVEDLVRADALAGDAAPPQEAVGTRALFAPGRVRLALLCDDAESLRLWTSERIADLALYSVDAPLAIASATALLHAAADDVALPPAHAVALRRVLAMIDRASNAIEFLALAARFGTLDEARLAVDLLAAQFAPQRRYIDAHRQLARAHVLLRTDERATAIDCAGDAARAFDAIGARYWTNQAMLLLVRPDHVDEPSLRRRPTAVSLTRREQQVAHLIRRGASNREVARTLQISEHTVERHVSSILSRLGLRSRWQIADVRIVTSEH
jgi:DNA-binding NarL/FixJ family response regulator